MAAPLGHGWNHPKCWPCWVSARGLVEPHRIAHPRIVTCCWCGRQTNEGIVVREKPQSDDVAYCADNLLDRTLFFSNL